MNIPAMRPSRRFRLLVVAMGLLLATTGFQTPIQGADPTTLPPQTVTPGTVNLVVKITLPPGHKINPEAPPTLRLQAQDQGILALDRNYSKLNAQSFPLTVPVPAKKEGQTVIQGELRLNFCDDQGGLCFMRQETLHLPVTVSKQAAGKNVEMVFQVPAP